MPEHWEEFLRKKREQGKEGVGNEEWKIPEPPKIDTKKMFWRMMRYVVHISGYGVPSRRMGGD